MEERKTRLSQAQGSTALRPQAGDSVVVSKEEDGAPAVGANHRWRDITICSRSARLSCRAIASPQIAEMRNDCDYLDSRARRDRAIALSLTSRWLPARHSQTAFQTEFQMTQTCHTPRRFTHNVCFPIPFSPRQMVGIQLSCSLRPCESVIRDAASKCIVCSRRLADTGHTGPATALSESPTPRGG